jgi:hypothetical protein
MPSRLTILAAVAIASLAFGTTAFARGGHGGMSGGMHGGHVGGFGHGHFFFGGVGYGPYVYNDDGYYDEESCPLVRRRVATHHGLRWRLVRTCAY